MFFFLFQWGTDIMAFRDFDEQINDTFTMTWNGVVLFPQYYIQQTCILYKLTQKQRRQMWVPMWNHCIPTNSIIWSNYGVSRRVCHFMMVKFNDRAWPMASIRRLIFYKQNYVFVTQNSIKNHLNTHGLWRVINIKLSSNFYILCVCPEWVGCCHFFNKRLQIGENS